MPKWPAWPSRLSFLGPPFLQRTSGSSRFRPLVESRFAPPGFANDALFDELHCALATLDQVDRDTIGLVTGTASLSQRPVEPLAPGRVVALEDRLAGGHLEPSVAHY